MYSSYFVVKIPKKQTWFVLGIIRNSSHIAIERSLDKKTGEVEFFVAPGREEEFENLINSFSRFGLELLCERRENRLLREPLDRDQT